MNSKDISEKASSNPPNPALEKSRHVHSIDGLRWWSFLFVFLSHALNQQFPFGYWGVAVFFTISGFLIGGILLDIKNKTDMTLFGKIRIFWIRRGLRIFPVYYAVLTMLIIFTSLGILQRNSDLSYFFHYLYLTNFHIFIFHENIFSFTHLWSLSIEEHFYLIIPWIVLGFNAVKLRSFCIFIIVLLFFVRFFDYYLFRVFNLSYVSFMQFDLMLYGVLFSLMVRRKSGNGRVQRFCLGICPILWLFLIFVMFMKLTGYLPEMSIWKIFEPSVLGLATSVLLIKLWSDDSSLTARLLAWPPAVYLGKISYGLYLYHNFLFVTSRIFIDFPAVLRYSVVLISTIIVASISWYLFELPINNLKSKFNYYDK